MKNIILHFFLSALLTLTSCSFDVGGVRVGNNMEAYALEYLENNNLLYSDEKILAYYDYTISLDGTEAAILTDSRLIYHNKETSNTYFLLNDITEINYYEEGVEGLIIEAWKGDELMIIEIAMWNDGDIFLNLLKKRTRL